MDGFDDLLAPSRRTLEQNPFADPFAKRSGSPDPWASFTHQPTVDTEDSDPYSTSAAAQDRSTTPTTTTESFATGEENEGSSIIHSTSGLVDPLDSAARTADDDDEPSDPPTATSPRTPGFRESIIPSTYSQTETIRNLEPEEIAPPPEARPQPLHEPTPRVADASFRPTSPPSTRSPERPSRSSTTGLSPSPSVSKSHQAVMSPLERPSSSGVDRSFASLALGGETAGGWQSTRGTWTNDSPIVPSATQRSIDEEEPVRQTAELETDRRAVASPSKDTVSVPSKADNGIQPVFIISVDDPQKVGDPIRSFTMYTVHTRTTSSLFQKSAFSVLRRYSDFLWLYETLSVNNPGVVVPPVPEKSPFGRFDDQFVQQRRLALEKCIQKTANHPILGKDPDLKMFLESDSFALDIKHRKAEIAHERGGLMASIGQTIAGPRFYETDDWFDRQKSYLDSLESQLRGLVKAIEVVAKHRTELALAMGEFSHTVSELSSSDVGKQLCHSLASIAEVEHKAQDLQNVQSQQDMITIMSTVDEYARLINSVRLAFSSRVRTYHIWQNADGEVRRVKQAHERNRTQGRMPSDRLGHSLSLIAEAERRALDAKHDFDHASKLIKSEVARFEQERIEDFKDSLHAFLEGMISRQKEVINAWEGYQQSLLKKVTGPAQRPVVVSATSSVSSS